jgi:hypothetical protein
MIGNLSRNPTMCNSKMLAIGAAVATGGLSLAVTGIPKNKKNPAPAALTPPPVAQEVKTADIDAMRKANLGINAGISSTMLTGPGGVTDPLDLRKNKLLGQ